ncbi:hypothetical protein HDK77DRAFT_453341 [Phyllosticta capitalensis]
MRDEVDVLVFLLFFFFFSSLFSPHSFPTVMTSIPANEYQVQRAEDTLSGCNVEQLPSNHTHHFQQIECTFQIHHPHHPPRPSREKVLDQPTATLPWKQKSNPPS